MYLKMCSRKTSDVMQVLAVLFCVVSALVVQNEGAIVTDDVRPVMETDLELTAADADAGNWTAKLGNMEINIEHTHEKSAANASGKWTLDIARTSYEVAKESKGENEQNPKIQVSEESKGEIEQNPEIEVTEEIHHTMPYEIYDEDSTPQPEYIRSDIAVDEDMSRELSGTPADAPVPVLDDNLQPPVQNYGLDEFYHMLFSPKVMQKSEENESPASDEVILDPDNFEYFKGVGWFKLDGRPMNWADARDTCAEVGAHLAVPDTRERAKVFVKLFERHPEIPANAILRHQAYVGVSDPLMNREFSTVQGKPFSPGFPIWFLNEPDNAPPGEGCVTFHTEGRIRDVPCFYSLPFFCEKDVPDYLNEVDQTK